MDKVMKNEFPMHRDCAPHDAEHCCVNDHVNNGKTGFDVEKDDCGHYVNAGPGVGIPKFKGHNGTIVAGSGEAPSSAKDDQDPKHGPGVE